MSSRQADATPLVCIHGFSGSWRNWVPVVPALEEHHDVSVARLAGHARGPRLPAGTAVTVEALADQLERDLDRAGIGRAHLVGNSLGGWLSLELASRGRALSVTALSPALGWEPRGRHIRQLALKLKTARPIFSAVAPYAEMVLRPRPIRHLLLSAAMAHSDRVSVVDAAAFVRDNLRCEVYHELMADVLARERHLGSIDCPVHIAWSARDTLIPLKPYGARFPKLVPQAEFSTLAGVGHVPMYDDPDLVARTILDFTTQVDAELASNIP
ncbi:alpha/beta fold hydrolase [Mycolicibacterium sp. XJ1819]